MRCDLIYLENRGEKHALKCAVCHTVYVSRRSDPAAVKAQCQVRVNEFPEIPVDLQPVVQAEAKKRGILLGDLIAEMTKAVGIPPCGGCEKRRQWLNKVHAWLRGD